MSICDLFSNKPKVPKYLKPVEETIMEAVKPWNHFVTDYGSTGRTVDTGLENIVSRKYIPDMASALRVANLLLSTIRKERLDNLYSSRSYRTLRMTDNDSYFNQCAVNWLASILYYFVHKMPYDGYGNEKLCDLPHVIAFMQIYDSEMLDVLGTCPTISFAMLPVVECYKEKSMEAYVAIVSTVQAYFSILATPECFWLLSSENTRKEHPFASISSSCNFGKELWTCFQQTHQDIRDYVCSLLYNKDNGNGKPAAGSGDTPREFYVIDQPK